MLAIRLQRVGRKGLPQYRIVVQESQRSPKSGKVVKQLGHYNPHTKEKSIDVETATKFLNNGAQPSERVVKLLKDEGVKLPKWVEQSDPKERKTRNPEKLRKNQPAKPEEKPEEKPQETVEEKTEEKPAEAPAAPEAEVVEEAAKDEPQESKTTESSDSEEKPTDKAEETAEKS